MKQIRRGVFETNSSSTHSICICTKNDYEKWKNGELLYDLWEEQLVPFHERLGEDIYEYKTYEEYMNGYYLEKYAVPFTTPSGDEMIAFGEYGFDG